MEGDSCTATVGVPVLPMRATLPHLLKPELHQKRGNFARLQNWNRAHLYATRIV